MAVVVLDDILRSAGIDEGEARLALALRLFEDDRLTLAQASRLAGLPRLEFQHQLAKRGIAVHYGMDQLDADLQFAAELQSN